MPSAFNIQCLPFLSEMCKLSEHKRDFESPKLVAKIWSFARRTTVAVEPDTRFLPKASCMEIEMNNLYQKITRSNLQEHKKDHQKKEQSFPLKMLHRYHGSSSIKIPLVVPDEIAHQKL